MTPDKRLEDKIVRLYEGDPEKGLTGLSVREIAALPGIGYSTHTVWKVLHSRGVKLRPPYRQENPLPPIDEVKNLYYVEDLSARAIGSIYGITPKRILDQIRKARLPLKNKLPVGSGWGWKTVKKIRGYAPMYTPKEVYADLTYRKSTVKLPSIQTVNAIRNPSATEWRGAPLPPLGWEGRRPRRRER